MQRLEQYSGLKQDLQGIGGAFLCDVEQWPRQGRSLAGPLFPMPADSRHRGVPQQHAPLLGGGEHVAAQGFHIYPQVQKEYKSVMEDVLKPLTQKEVKELSGNAMSLPVWVAWVMYVFAHTEKVLDMKPVAETCMLRKGSSTAEFELAMESMECSQVDEHSEEKNTLTIVPEKPEALDKPQVAKSVVVGESVQPASASANDVGTTQREDDREDDHDGHDSDEKNE